jgi:hypothetical protein
MDLLEIETIVAMLFVAGLLFSIVLASIPAPKKKSLKDEEADEAEKRRDETTRERCESYVPPGSNATALSSYINSDPV